MESLSPVSVTLHLQCRLVWVPEFGSVFVFSSTVALARTLLFVVSENQVWLEPAELQPSPSSWIFLSTGNPKMGWDLHVEVHQHTPPGVKGDGFLLGQSRHTASLKIVSSSEISTLFWRLTPPWWQWQSQAWVSSHTKHNNQGVFRLELSHSTETGSDGNTSPGCQDCCCIHSCRIFPELFPFVW